MKPIIRTHWVAFSHLTVCRSHVTVTIKIDCVIQYLARPMIRLASPELSSKPGEAMGSMFAVITYSLKYLTMCIDLKQ